MNRHMELDSLLRPGGVLYVSSAILWAATGFLLGLGVMGLIYKNPGAAALLAVPGVIAVLVVKDRMFYRDLMPGCDGDCGEPWCVTSRECDE